MRLGYLTDLAMIDHRHRLFLYGAGGFGRHMLSLLRAASFPMVTGFLDSFRTGRCEGLPVWPLAEYLAQRQPGDQIIITTSTEWDVLEALRAAAVNEVFLVSAQKLRPPATGLDIFHADDPKTANMVLSSRSLHNGRDPMPGDLVWQGVFGLWGEAYYRFLVDAALPSLLAEGNLPAMRRWPGSSVAFYLPAAEAGRLLREPIIAEVARHVSVHIHTVRDIVTAEGQAKYDAMNRVQHAGIVAAERQAEVLSILVPDAVYSDGFLDAAMRRIEEGYHAVVSPSAARAKGPALLSELAELRQANSLTLPPRQLVSLYFRHRHPLVTLYQVDASPFSDTPANLLWPVGEDGEVLRSLMAYPLMVRPQRRAGYYTQTVDHDYVPHSVPDSGRIYVCSDSDELFSLDIVPDSVQMPQVNQPVFDPQRYREFLWRYIVANDAYWYFRKVLRTPYLTHTQMLDAELWSPVLRQSEHVIEHVLSGL